MKNLLHYTLIVLISCNAITLMAQSANSTNDKPVFSVEQMPQYPGGDEALLKFIKDNLKYPMLAAEKGIEGRVTIRFVVDRDGTVNDVTVIRGLDSLCDKEAVRVVKMMPTWMPGKQSGKAIPVYYTLPIVYKLQKDVANQKIPLLIVDGNPKPFGMLKDTSLLKPSDIKSISVLKDSAATAIYGEMGKNGVILIETKEHALKNDTVSKEDKPVYGVEVMPQFPGGDEALLNFIKENLHYPSSDAQFGIQGRTTVRFVINKLGQVCDVTVIRSLSKACDAEAIRVVKKMPNWIPGKQEGKPMSVYYTLPIVYKLQQ